jgi:hypothetical protein
MQIETRESQRYRISHNVSYLEAVKQTGGTTVRTTDGASMAAPVISGHTVWAGASAGPGMISRPVQKSCDHECAVSKDTLIVNKVNFMAFIGKVMNTTWVVESRNARSKLIVDMAK